jgi:hypothetical protein
LLWLIGIPIPNILLLWIFGLHALFGSPQNPARLARTAPAP